MCNKSDFDPGGSDEIITIITIVPSYTWKISLICCLWHCYSFYALYSIKITIFSYIALYCGDTLILLSKYTWEDSSLMDVIVSPSKGRLWYFLVDSSALSVSNNGRTNDSIFFQWNTVTDWLTCIYTCNLRRRLPQMYTIMVISQKTLMGNKPISSFMKRGVGVFSRVLMFLSKVCPSHNHGS